MNEKILKIKLEIEKKFLLLELNNQFLDLLNQMKNNYHEINDKFELIVNKEKLDYLRYYTELSDFYNNEVVFIINLLKRHQENEKNDIFDDSKNEISEKLEQKQKEVLECIKNVDETYHDDTITNYIKNKYDLIMENYHKKIQEYLNYRESIIINLYLEKDLNKAITSLTLYPNINYIKNDCILELKMTLDNVVKYLNALIENRKTIEETENSLLERINKIKDNKHLLKVFNNMKLRFITKTSTIHELDSKLCNIQKDYLKELNDFVQELIDIEEHEKRTSILLKIFEYLKDTDIFKIKFSKLREIDNYLVDREDYQVKIVLERLYETYYEIIKYELYYTGESIIYDDLNDDIKRNIEKLFLEELKSNKELLIQEKSLQKILLEPFSIEILKEFVKYLMPNETIDLESYQIDDKKRVIVIPYLIFKEKAYFDNNNEALIMDDDRCYYVVNKDGNVNKVNTFKSDNIDSDFARDFKIKSYHDGIIIYSGVKKHVTPNGNVIYPSCMVIADINGGVYKEIDCLFKHIKVKLGEYNDGLICVKTDIFNEIWYIDKYGNVKIHIKGKEVIGYDFSDGVAFVKVNGRFRAIDTTGKTLFKLDKDITEVYSFKNGIARIRDKIGNRRFIDKTGKHILKDFCPFTDKDPKYDFTHGYAICMNNNLDFISIDVNGQGLACDDQRYESVNDFKLSNHSLYKINGNYKFIKKDVLIKDSDTLIEIFKDFVGNKTSVDSSELHKAKDSNILINNNTVSDKEIKKSIISEESYRICSKTLMR